MELHLRRERITETVWITKTCFPKLTESNGYSSRSEVFKLVAWGSREDCLGRSNLDLPLFFRRCPHSCLAAKPNHDRWQLRTLMFLHLLPGSLRTFACWHVYSSSVSKLLDHFLMQMREQAKTATPDLTSGWKSIPRKIYKWNWAWTPSWNSARTMKAKESTTNG